MARRPLHLGYWAQPQNGPRAEFRFRIAPPQSGQAGLSGSTRAEVLAWYIFSFMPPS